MTRALRIPLPGWLRLGAAIFVSAGAAGAAPGTALDRARPATPASGDRLPPDSASSNEPKTREQLEAQQHFLRAKDLYQTGAYREAITELEQARQLDPKAKDLVFNLGIVHEKLGRFDEAIAFFRQYMDLESVTAPERAKAETITKRIEGAKREVPAVAPSAAPGANGNGTGAPLPPPPPPPETRSGRIDAATITAGSIAVVGLGVGASFGILALSNEPSDNAFTTGRDGSYDALRTKTKDSHTQAIVADVGFGVGIAAALVTAYLYFGRTREPKPAAALLRVLPSAATVPSGGVMMLGGTFR